MEAMPQLYYVYMKHTLVGIVMPIVIIVILGIALLLYARKRNSDEIRRIREKAERDAALYEQRLEREAREVEERCAGKSVEEQVRIREEFCARLEADMKCHEARAREIEKARKAAEEARSKEYDMSPGTKGALLFMAGAAVGSMASKSRKSGCSSRRRSMSHGCGCDCDDFLEGRHHDCEDDCELW